MNNIQMLYFNKIDVSEWIDVNKTSASKECDIWHYWYFLNFSFKFLSNACKRSLDLLMISKNLSDIAILNIKGLDYHCIMSLITKNEGHIPIVKCWFDQKKVKHKAYIKMGKKWHIKMGKKSYRMAILKLEK